MKLLFEKISRFDRPAEPCSVAVPLAAGELPIAGGEFGWVAVFDGRRALPTQSRVTARWPDGSVKWLLVHFLADLPGGAPKELVLRAGKAPPAPAVAARVREDERGGLTVSAGRLRAGLWAG